MADVMIILKIKRRILWFLVIRIVHILFQPPRGEVELSLMLTIDGMHGEILVSRKGAIATEWGEVDKL